MSPTTYRYEPEHVLPPGATLQEVLEEKAMSQTDLARRTGLSVKHVNQVVKGNAAVTAETAILLERATGVAAGVWANLESAYQVDQSRAKDTERLSADLDWLASLPVQELRKRGWIEEVTTPVDTLREVCRFFGVADKASWEELWQRPTAYRRSKVFSSDPGAVAAWLRIGEIEAAELRCKPFEKQALVSRLSDLRSLTRESDPSAWFPKLREIGQEAGVAIVLEPEIPGARVVGAARWVTPEKALVQLSLRHRWSDIFWFTLFHELGHLILHSKKDVFINDPGPHSGAEAEADAFAAQLLVPRKFETRLGGLNTEADVRKFATELGVGADIVVGRLQFEKRWPYNKGNGLKHRFAFKN
jgi:HTH-type transcriptional regulator / antitoxin HigA